MTVKQIIEEVVADLKTMFTFVFGDKGYQNIEADNLTAPFFFMDDDFQVSTTIAESETQINSFGISVGIYFENKGIDDLPTEKWELKTQALATKHEFLYKLQNREEVQEINSITGNIIGLPAAKDNYLTGIDLTFTVTLTDRHNYCFK